MAIFNTDIEALVAVVVLGLLLYVISKLITNLFYRIKSLTIEQKNKIKFLFRAISIVIIVYLFIEGFPSFDQIDPAYTAILTGAISAAVAFASSEIFSNFIAGILLLIIDPFDIGDIVKIKGHKGRIKSITLTRVELETFDNVLIDMANSEIVSSIIQNYTINLKKVKSFYHFKKEVLAPQDIGKAHLDAHLFENSEMYEKELKELYDKVLAEKLDAIHAFTFKMQLDYRRFRIIIDKLDKLCAEYKNKFGYKPRFHIVDIRNDITIKFRIITLDADDLIEYQPEFAKDIYKVILSKT